MIICLPEELRAECIPHFLKHDSFQNQSPDFSSLVDISKTTESHSMDKNMKSRGIE